MIWPPVQIPLSVPEKKNASKILESTYPAEAYIQALSKYTPQLITISRETTWAFLLFTSKVCACGIAAIYTYFSFSNFFLI